MNPNRNHIYGLIFVLFFIGLSFFLYRHFILDVPLTDNENVNSWIVEANLRFTSDRNAPVKVSLSIPYMTPNYTILDEYFISKNYGVMTYLTGYNRRVAWTLRRSTGIQSLYYRAVFRETNQRQIHLPKPPPLPKAKELSETQTTAIETIISKARASSADIQTFAQSTITELNKQDGNARLLVGNSPGDQQLVDAAITILNQAKIYAVPIKGIYLTQQNKAAFHIFLAVYNAKEWLYINPHTAAAGLPKNFLVWQYGDDPMIEITGGKNPRVIINVSPTPMNALSLVKARGLKTESALMRFSLLQLPVDAQETYKILLMVPVGAFIILLLRNFIGLTTFGTFMPVLIALAFRETHLFAGIILFTLIIAFGLLVRFYLDNLRLLLVPRLAAILTVVILLMIFISVLGQNLGLNSGLSVALFPMVILTMTIERMCILWDERGANAALKCGVGSMVAAVICYGVMNLQFLQYLIFAFPELLLISSRK